MNNEVLIFLENLFSKYSQNDFEKWPIEAKKEYLQLTGEVYEDEDEYESKMNCFGDWFLLNYYIDKASKQTILQYHLRKNDVPKEMAVSLLRANYSLFDVVFHHPKKSIIVQDIINGQKIALDQERSVGLVKNDLFLGRIIHHNNKNFLLNGICGLPAGSRTALIKSLKKKIIIKNKENTNSLLLKIEGLKTKWLRYTHLSPEKIFSI